MHSPAFTKHEEITGKIAKQIGFEQISMSHVIIPMVKIVHRGFTATLDAYLNPYSIILKIIFVESLLQITNFY